MKDMIPDSGWRRKLYIIIFETDTPLGKKFDVLLLWAILLSVLGVLLGSDPDIRSVYGGTIDLFEISFTFLFTLEYILRLAVVKKPHKYALSFFGLIDLMAILPTYISFIVGGSTYLVVIRAIRLLRVFRVLKLFRYLKESQVLLSTMQASRAKITVFLGAVLTLVLIMGTLMYIIETGNPGFTSIFKSMYWAIVTMTTVGYGDAVPHTPLGKFLASAVMIMGYAILAVPTGIVTAELFNAERQHRFNKQCSVCHADVISDDSRYCHICGVEL